MEPGFTWGDFLLITFWACLLFLCIAILHLLVPLWRLLDGVLPFSFVLSWVNRSPGLAYDVPLARLDFRAANAVRSWTITSCGSVSNRVWSVAIGGADHLLTRSRFWLIRSALVCPLLVPSHLKLPAADLIYLGDA